MVKRLPRQWGLILMCDGTFHTSCTEQFQTALSLVRNQRFAAKREGWGRGLLRGRKAADQCPYHFKLEKFLLEQRKWARAVELARRDELKKAKASAAPLPKKPHKKKSPLSPPSVDSAQVAATS
jgi:hypothetical protein